MALITGSAIFVFDTEVVALTTASVIAANGFAGGTNPVTNVAPLADAVLDVDMAVAPVASDSFHLYRRDLNISGANHATVPDATYNNIYLGSFPLDLVTGQQFISLTDIPLAADQEFYIENDSAQATTGTTVLTIKPKSYNAQA